jgi:uncharacterized membrane protein YeaQ/YmgE (transglycosylase-associated protein family)
MVYMSMIGWILLGMTAGFVVSVIVNRRMKIIPTDILIGIAGACTSGWLFGRFASSGATGINAWGFLAAVAGSVALLIIWHAMCRSQRRA